MPDIPAAALASTRQELTSEPAPERARAVAGVMLGSFSSLFAASHTALRGRRAVSHATAPVQQDADYGLRLQAMQLVLRGLLHFELRSIL